MKVVNPPDWSLSVMLSLPVPLEWFSSATAQARHADEPARIGLLRATLFNVLLHAGTREHEISHSGRTFSAEVIGHCCFMCPGEYRDQVLCRLPGQGGLRHVLCQHWAQGCMSGQFDASFSGRRDMDPRASLMQQT